MNQQKAKAALFASAIGDSLGALTEFMSYQQITTLCNNQLVGYVENERFLNMGGILGTVTDDFGSSYYIMKEIIKYDGIFNKEIACNAIIEWSKDAYYFKFSGRTTKKSVELLKEDINLAINNGVNTNFIGQATNGAAMKVVPIALLANGDVEKAIEYAIDLAYPTHYNSHAIAGAAAIAASITTALKDDSTWENIYEAGIYAAEKSQNMLEFIGRGTIGPSVSYRIKQAILIGKESNGYEELMVNIDQKVGTNMETWESIAAIYGILAGTKENCLESFKVAVNVGGDTDSMAALAGAIIAAKEGLEILPKEWIDFVHDNNPGINVKGIVDEYTDLLERICK